jgi:hypothetical protein
MIAPKRLCGPCGQASCVSRGEIDNCNHYGPLVVDGESIGPELVGPELVGPELVGTELAGTELAGTELAGTELAGTELVGTKLIALGCKMNCESANDLGQSR